ncbi:MAG: glycosyltransferase [Bacteroidia bacterium]|nr:glycosyltransferase [Bacteroidia bacterium]
MIEVTRDGKPLKNGITAVIAAKNENYMLPFCLKSLIGVVDQIVCIDNGSEDDTLQIMYDFKKENEDKMEIIVLHMPNALLGDCREAGLSKTKYKWHLRWDADMICKTSGTESMLLLRQKALKENRPVAYVIPRTNLVGDLRHVSLLYPVVDPGEPFLMRFGKHICYREFGKFDTVKLPFYHKIVQESKRYYFHCAGLKSDVNLVHRFFYFSWREAFNNEKRSKKQQQLLSYQKYRKDKELELFDTNNQLSLFYRFQRQCVLHFEQYNVDLYGDYPEILKNELVNEDERFKVIYKDGKPSIRIDKKDQKMIEYIPTAEDLKWDPLKFLKDLISDNEFQNIIDYLNSCETNFKISESKQVG